MFRKTFLIVLMAVPSIGICDQHYIQNPPEMTTQTNGYSRIVIDTNHEQKKPLDTVVSIEFPPGIRNVGQSLNYILQNSGYHLLNLEQTAPDTLHLYTLDIPLTQRAFYQSTILQILEALAGQSYIVNVDHIRREISITPNPSKGN